MSVVDSPLLTVAETLPLPAQRLFTVEDLEAFPTEIPSGPIDYELDNGRLVFIMVPPGVPHGTVQLTVGAHLKMQGDLQGHGKAMTEVGVILWRGPDRVVTPDVLFLAKKSLPARISREGYLETIPELVVEVRSKNDSIKYMERKVAHYLKAGVEIVWVVDPSVKTVAVHKQTGEPSLHREGDVLELPGIIPNFSLALVDVFRE